MNGDLNLKFESGTAASESGSIQDDLTEVGECEDWDTPSEETGLAKDNQLIFSDQTGSNLIC
jgi:hypothetical protein